MEQSQRTAWGAYLQTCLLQNLPFTMMANTTLNEKFGVQAGVPPSPGILPSQRYYCIGNGGAGVTAGADSVALSQPPQHQATDAALFNHLPFIMRPVSADLSTSQMAQYALRQVITWNSVPYACYFLRRINFTGVGVELDMVTVSKGLSTITPYVPDASNLNPRPPTPAKGSINNLSGDYITAAAIVKLSFSAQDVTELINCANIIYGDPRYAVVNEIGLVSGVDKVVNVPVSGGSFNMSEVICAQICSFFNTYQAMNYQNGGVNNILSIGSTEPLFVLQDTRNHGIPTG
ncbi:MULTISPECIES: hypothetical protein [unclassified Caballeronia]|jgi:hypothetical protein|uniref:DUF7208 family protein n=1 Tax=unclassified Caballeronia TaxID=2646786 RepID=UPI002027D2E2|nr:MULTISPECIES: hypothetical protein [unclassified Caballeronia]